MARKSRRKHSNKRRKSRKRRNKKGSGSGLGDGVFDHESAAMTPEEVGAVTAETHYGRTCKIHPKKGDRYAIYEADGSLSPGARDEKEDVFKFKHFPSEQHALAKCNKAIKSDKLCKHRDGSADTPWKTTTSHIPSDYLDKSYKKFKSFRKCYNFVMPHSIGRVAALPEDKRYCYQTKNKTNDVRWLDHLVGQPHTTYAFRKRYAARPTAGKREKTKEKCEEKLSAMGKLAGPDYVYNMPKIEKKGGKRKSRKRRKKKGGKKRRRSRKRRR